MTVWAFDPTGNPDTGFGTGGVFFAPDPIGVTDNTRGFGIGVDAFDRIYVGGIIQPPDGMVVWRLDSNGTEDPTFGSGGFALLASGLEWGQDVALDACERAVVTGRTGGEMAIWRYH